MFLLASTPESLVGLPLIVLAGVTTYIASKALGDALVGARNNAPGRLALGQWLPIAVLALSAVATDRPAIAIGLVFSSTVACLCLAMGAVALLGSSPIANVPRPCWILLLPSILLVFLAGFKGVISLPIAGIFILQGAAVLLVWTDRSVAAGQPPPVIAIESDSRNTQLHIVQFILALAVSVVGSWLALHGIDLFAQGSEFASAGLLTATLLSPLLILPIIGTGTELSQRQKSAVAIDAQMGVALLNICALLPMVVITSYLKQWVTQTLVNSSIMHWTWPQLYSKPIATTAPSTLPRAPEFHALPFPLAVWRVDVVMLIALALFLMPVALGRWSLSKQQGLWMMCGYAVYLALAIKFQGYLLYGVRSQ